MNKQAEYSKKYYEKNKNNIEFKLKRKQWYKNWRLNNREKAKKLNRKWARKNPDKVKNAALKLKFNITIKDYNKLLLKQNNKCAICLIDSNKLNKKLAVDHCHKTNKIRGLLCMLCNRALGSFKDDINILENAKEYLKCSRV